MIKVTVVCDGDGLCDNEISAVVTDKVSLEEAKREAMRLAHGVGWALQGGQALCPSHQSHLPLPGRT